MVIGERDKQARSGILVALNQRLRFPVEQRPLRAQILVAEVRGVSVMRILELVVGRTLHIHVARIPVAIFRNALRAPMRPDAELGVAIPLGRVVLQQRIPICLIRAIAAKPSHRRLHGHTVPRAAGQLGRLTPLRRCPVWSVEFRLNDLAIDECIEDALALRGGAELFIRLMKCVETGRRIQGCLSFYGNGTSRGGGRDQLAKVSSLHL